MIVSQRNSQGTGQRTWRPDSFLNQQAGPTPWHHRTAPRLRRPADMRCRWPKLRVAPTGRQFSRAEWMLRHLEEEDLRPTVRRELVVRTIADKPGSFTPEGLVDGVVSGVVAPLDDS